MVMMPMVMMMPGIAVDMMMSGTVIDMIFSSGVFHNLICLRG